MTRPARLISIALTLGGLALAVAAHAGPPEYVQEVLIEAKRHVIKVPDQVAVLAGLAWAHDEDPQVRAAARDELVRYGHYSLPVLRRMLPDTDPLFQGDMIAAFIEARFRNPHGMPQDYLPGLEEAIWYGSPEAQRIALNEIQRYVFPPAVLSSIDAAYENPILTRYVVKSLGRMNDPRARLFLSDLLISGSDFYKGAAARALEHFGQRAVDDFRSGVGADDRAAREHAMRVFLPLTDTSDLDLLRGYLAERTEDDPELREAVHRRIGVLERRLAP